MLNYLWAGMTLIGILWAAFHGNLNAVTDGALTAAKEAVALCITMLGVVSFWTGILEIGQRAGIIERISARMRPLLTFLFPGIPGKHPAMEAIAANMIANVLGLGWAATPAGLKAMEELSKLEKERGTPGFLEDSENSERRASNEMCTFLILNISSLQLIPVNMIAYRSQYGSVNPTAIVGPAVLATCLSTIVAVLYCRWNDKQ